MRNENSPEIPDISIIIPSLNGEAPLAELLASLSIQSVEPREVLVLDSSSSDASVAVAKSHGARVLTINRQDFDHGGTRSYGAQCASTGIVVFFTQDVILAHRRVLELLVKSLLAEEDIAISYGRQLPTFAANPIAAHLRNFNYPSKPSCRSYADRTLYGLGTIFTSNSCAAYRKSDLADIDFFKDGLIFGEDTHAAGKLLQNGKKIAYCADATVYHSHNYEWGEEFSRYFDIGVLHSEQSWLLETYGTTGGRGKRYVSSGMSYLYRRGCAGLIPDFMVRVVLKLCGYQLGRQYRRLPAGLAAKLSMNKHWWQTDSGT